MSPRKHPFFPKSISSYTAENLCDYFEAILSHEQSVCPYYGEIVRSFEAIEGHPSVSQALEDVSSPFSEYGEAWAAKAGAEREICYAYGFRDCLALLLDMGLL